MRLGLFALGGLLAACSAGGAGADAGGPCTVDADCPVVGCQCSNGVNLPSACLCEGGRTATGCGPGGVCATAADCAQACAQEQGLGGTTGGSGGGGGGGSPCASNADCQPVACSCADAGATSVTAYCLQGQCVPGSACPAC